MNAERNKDKRKPEWADPDGEGFSSSVVPGVPGGHDGMTSNSEAVSRGGSSRPVMTPAEYADGVLKRNRTVIGQAITLIESNAPHHLDAAQDMLRRLLPHTGNSVRIGITGVPGAGKSTFIDVFGSMLCRQELRVAVLAIDPSSHVTRGSILGDKTRMEELMREPNSFIRPSPSGGALGGVNRKTRETMLVCEAAGYDVILIETVGVGQSEDTVRSMSDIFLLLTLTGAGDELQNVKRGVIESADAILINKADGQNQLPARRLQSEFNQTLRYLTSPTPNWEPRAFCLSAQNRTGLPEIWTMIERFCEVTKRTGTFESRRKDQVKDWVMSMVFGQLQSRFLQHQEVAEAMPGILAEVDAGKRPATSAARDLLSLFEPISEKPTPGNYPDS